MNFIINCFVFSKRNCNLSLMTFNVDVDVAFVSIIDDEVNVNVDGDGELVDDDADDSIVLVLLLLVGITILSPPLFIVFGCLFTTIPGVGKLSLPIPDDNCCCCCCGCLDKLGCSVFCNRGKIISAAFFMVAAAVAS